MNWRFGFSLGKTEFDGQIYGAASAAADCLKALVPFFLFAAIRNRMWSQAAASAVIWVVVTSFSLTSALGHAALNRYDTAGKRAADTQTYADLRADLKRAQDQLGWVPRHRPSATVQAEIDGLKGQKAWGWTKGCTEVTGKFNRDTCTQYHALVAELGSAQQAMQLEARIADTQTKIARATGGTVSSEADPQAAVLAKLAQAFVPSVKIDDVQTAMTIFIALLLEIGSGLGLYAAFAYWRLDDRIAPSAPAMAVRREAEDVVAVAMPATVPAHLPVPAAAVAEPALPDVASIKPRIASSANDNRTAVAGASLVAPETDVQRYYKERIDSEEGSSLTATSLYEDYCAWCEEQTKEPLALPTFGREFAELGVQKAKIAGRVRYIGIGLRSGFHSEEDKKLPALRPEAA
jgi:hypothetical protein